MIILLMSIHLAAALLLFLGWLNGVIHMSPALLPAAFLLPLWGPLCVVVYELHFRGGEKADQEAESIRFGITDEVYRNVRMDKGGVEDVLPIEDVLVSGSPRQRRSLLLSVLHSGPRDFVRSLRIAGVNDDTEVVHYAVTALVEIRSEYTQRIAEMEKKLSACPGDPRILLAYANLDEEYLRSGIPEESEKTELIVDPEKTQVLLRLTIDTRYGSVMDYFEIFLQRMILCRKAAEKLGLEFKLMINDHPLI